MIEAQLVHNGTHTSLCHCESTICANKEITHTNSCIGVAITPETHHHLEVVVITSGTIRLKYLLHLAHMVCFLLSC